VIDAVLLVWAAGAWAGFIFSRVAVHTINGKTVVGPLVWTPRTVIGVILLPSVIALKWRRQYPVAVLGVALVAEVAVYPFPFIFVVVALFSVATRRSLLVAFGAWVATTACVLVGRLTSEGWSTFSGEVVTTAAATGAVTAVGMYIGARRAYVERLRERALFARALATFLPPAVASLIEASPGSLSLQQEVEATILFSDVRGFSTMAEALPPREVAEMIGRHLSGMASVVQAHGGTLDKFAGDAVMAVFGAPVQMPDHADRALHCAVGMQRRQAALNEEAARMGKPQPQIGVGVNTGTVVAGTLGGEGRLDYTVIGDAVNVAQRLQTEAAAGEILASAATIASVTGWRTEPLGARSVKGRLGSVEVHRVPWVDSE
jgi:class 3 adenylate cyclase